ncbi:MAG TPA: DUF484 family protein [Rhodocyclaceae bacterium]|jgi:uncharacterized protein YigA (DUF484 family)|nr:DUF484 family protein [Rhodocyclaceae bacterium]
MNAEEVAIYLKTHPEFFEQFGDLLANIKLPNPHGGAAASLADRQVAVLRERVHVLESKMGELLRFGEQNDGIAEKVHRLAVALMAANTLAEAVRNLYNHLEGAFAVPHVAVRIWGVGNGQDAAATEFAEVPDTLKAFAGSMINPYCGFSAGQEAVAWFGDRGERIRSIAQVPLREHGHDGGVCFGLLVLASEEVERFYPDMGTLYLSRIGDMASSALLRVVG